MTWHFNSSNGISLLAMSQPKIKFSIVTPTFNAERFLEQTISSVINQNGDFDIEYILVDNFSTDSTLEIINCFQASLEELNCNRAAGTVSITVVSEQDNGMYDAINKGFALASGDIYAWINADDIYLTDAFAKVAQVFSSFPHVQWLKGITSYIDEHGEERRFGKCYLYAQELIRRGFYGREGYFIQQDSVFWRANLWSRSGGLDASLRLAGDFALWLKFAHLEPLYSTNIPVSCFRKVKGQLSEDLVAYKNEQNDLVETDIIRTWMLRKYFSVAEPVLPGWMNFVVFRLLFPRAPLYYIDSDVEPFVIKSLKRYWVNRD